MLRETNRMMKKKMHFLYVIWYVRGKENEVLVKLQLSNFKNILFCSKNKGK